MSDNLRFNRRAFLRKVALFGGSFGLMPFGFFRHHTAGSPRTRPARKTPVILATDIGDDIDDTWALGFLLKSPELDLKLAVTEYGKSQYRAKLLAKFLQATGHAHVPVGIGPDLEPRGEGAQAAWVKDYDLGSYPGRIHPDGVQAVIDTIMQSKRPITLIGIGPMPNTAAALTREPRIAKHARLVGMDGSVRLGYGGSKTPAPEWNVKAAVKPAQQVLAAPWNITITPLDTCGLVTLEGEPYRRLRDSADPVASTIIRNYRLWSRSNQADAEHHSSVLFDTVAVYLAFSHKLCTLEHLRIRVTDDGFTRIDERGKRMTVATGWKNLAGYRDLLVTRLSGLGT